MSDLESLLSKNVDEIEAPKPFPSGHYVGMIQGFEFGKSSKKQTDFVQFEIKPVEAEDDVDQELLEESGGLGARTMRLTFYLTDASLFMLKDFIANDVQIEGSGRGLGELIPECQNESIRFLVEHRVNPNDPERTFAEIKKTFPVE